MVTQVEMVSGSHVIGRWTPPRPQVEAPTPGLYMTISGSVRLGLQVKPPATIGPWTPTWALAAARAGYCHCPQQQYGPEILTWPLILGICTAFDGSRSIRHQHRLWLQVGYGP